MTKFAIVGLVLLAVPAIANAGDSDGCGGCGPSTSQPPTSQAPAPYPTQDYGLHSGRSYGSGEVAVLVGTNTNFNGSPWTSRLSLHFGGDFLRGPYAALGFVLPVTWMSTGWNQFGVGRSNVLETAPSLQLRFLPNAPIRPYLDAGIGAVWATPTDNNPRFLFRNRTQETGWMTRAAFGLEMGPAHGPMVVLEPVQWETYDLGPHYSRWVAEIGLGARF